MRMLLARERIAIDEQAKRLEMRSASSTNNRSESNVTILKTANLQTFELKERKQC